ncbi:DUF4245 family protein [Microbacterium sp. X-17]|uniref:DUF4245 family protein n=1 Tax=Microbacterium sp. X-17 TaxID=3144404 RepID=UPI0031F5B3E6
MARGPRVVAELGRPETPEETADRKAESSRVYRSSQTFRNLIAALLVTLAVVVVVVLGVPRGDLAPTPTIDVAQAAQSASTDMGRPILVPDVSSTWLVNGAAVAGAEQPVWTIVYATDGNAFLRVSQAFGAGSDWALTTLAGKRPAGTTTIDGVPWDVWRISDVQSAGNVSFALGTQAGPDYVLVYGNADEATTTALASGLTGQIRGLEGGAR